MKQSLKILTLILLLTTFGCAPIDPNTALHRAARLGLESEVKAQLEAGQDVNKIIDGKTPLLDAAESIRPKTMALLLKKGADIKAKDSKDRDAWDLVLARGGGRFLLQKQAQALSLLIEHGMKPRMTLIQCAMNADSNVLVESLVKAGADLSATDKFGWTALHHAAIAGNADTCEALLKAGANPNAESTADFTERDNSDEFDSHVTYKFRYQAGSRPLDVVKDRATRGSRSARKVLTDAGATKNPKVKNKIRY